MNREGLNVVVSVVVSEANVNHQIDIELEAIVYSEPGNNKIIWRSKDGKYKLSVWKQETENSIKPENVDKDEKIVSSVVEIAEQINRIKLDVL
jgi:hypothetical protein